jgi:hypothetical protein
MSTEYNTVLAVGRWFNDEDEAVEFLSLAGVLKEEDLKSVSQYGLAESLPRGMSGGGLNASTGEGYYIGYMISTAHPSSFRKDFEDGMEQWDSLFLEEAEIVNEVTSF